MGNTDTAEGTMSYTQVDQDNAETRADRAAATVKRLTAQLQEAQLAWAEAEGAYATIANARRAAAAPALIPGARPYGEPFMSCTDPG
jgi:hypothetical protein